MNAILYLVLSGGWLIVAATFLKTVFRGELS